MTPLQKNILAACKHRPQTLRELQNALQVDNSRLRNTVTGIRPWQKKLPRILLSGFTWLANRL